MKPDLAFYDFQTYNIMDYSIDSENRQRICRRRIRADGQIKKFCTYGFLKNLKFFEPYLLISLMGKGISLFEIGILIVTVPSVNLIYLFSIIPYLLDFLLILSYPPFLDNADRTKKPEFRGLLKAFLQNFRKNRMLRHILLEEGIFESTISFIKDLIQPILEAIIVGSGVVILSSLSAEDNLNVVLGMVYAILNLLGSVASKKAYLLKGRAGNLKCLYHIHFLLAVSMAVLAFVSQNPFLVFAVCLLVYALFNIRKPIFVDEIDEHIEKSERATILSVSSQLKSLLLMVFAPPLGYHADQFGISMILCVLAGLFLVSLPLLKMRK